MTKVERRVLAAVLEQCLARRTSRNICAAWDRDGVRRTGELEEALRRFGVASAEVESAADAYIEELNYPDTLAAILAEPDDGS